MTNTLLPPYNTIFNVPPFNLINEDDYLLAFDLALEKGRIDIENILKINEKPTFQNTIEAIEYIGKDLTQVSSVFFNINHANTNSNIQRIARDVSPLLSDFSNDIWLNASLFERVKQVYNAENRLKLNDEQNQLLENTYKAFVRKGANLSDEQKQIYREVTKELSDISLQFGENVLNETNEFQLLITNPEELDGLPDAVVEAASELASKSNKGGWLFTLQMPSFLPFMKYSRNRNLRKEMFIAYSKRGNQLNNKNNQEVIKRITSLRLKKANLLGFKCYADYVLEERMAKSTEKVNGFLNELFEASKAMAMRDVDEVRAIAIEDGLLDDLEKWDFSFYSEILKDKKLNINDEILKPYFQLENIEKGIFDLVNNLYGLRFQLSSEIPVYHDEVKAFEVYDADGSFLSVLYIDYFPRPSKQGGAWMTSYRDQHKDGLVDVRPVISLVMNFTRPTDTKPSLLTHNEVLTFLHEFGHALHGMLSCVTYESLSGTSVYRDFVELPSQIMENWGYEKEWLRSIAVHYKTGEPISDHVINMIIESSKFQSGYAMLRQLSFGMMDMAWHSLNEPANADVVSFEQAAIAKTALLPHIEGTCSSTGFSHIFDGGYAAGYYGYKWAEVLDADAFEKFKQTGIFNRDTALSFRKNILEKGGTKHPMELYIAFTGSEPSTDPLLMRSGMKKRVR